MPHLLLIPSFFLFYQQSLLAFCCWQKTILARFYGSVAAYFSPTHILITRSAALINQLFDRVIIFMDDTMRHWYEINKRRL